MGAVRPMTILKLILGFALAVALLLVFSVAAYRPPAQTVHRPAAQMDYAVRHDAEAGDAAGTARSSYSMAFVELDDDGLLAEPAQVERLLADLGQKLAQADTTILLYVHGWNHNAALDDDNVLCFGELARAAALMQAGYRSRNGAPRAVYAIYVGWPGVVYRREAFNKAFTFFGRQAAADRIGERGDLLHLFSRIARLRDQHQSGGAGAKFVIVSHSLGARLTYKALRPVMQSSVSDGEDRRYALLADVAVLVNPALSADEHAVLAKLVGRAPVAGEARRAPRFVIATSERDEVLGGIYPWSQRIASFVRGDFAFRDTARLVPVGLFDDFVTHVLVLDPPGAYRNPPGRSGTCPTLRYDELEIVRGKGRVQRAAELYDFDTVRHYADDGKLLYTSRLHRQPGRAESDVMIVRVSGEIIPNHNDIFTSPFVDFISRVINAGLFPDQWAAATR